MKRSSFLIFVFLVILCATASAEQPQINPSGVWSMWDWNMNYTKVFSWGENPVNNEVDIIDLGAKLPYMIISSETFNVTSYTQEGFRFIFEGEWGVEKKTQGSIVIVFNEDGNSFYFESVNPEGFTHIGESYRLYRVPVDAPVVPIGPEGP